MLRLSQQLIYLQLRTRHKEPSLTDPTTSRGEKILQPVSSGGDRVAIQGERGSNSHMAALDLARGHDVLPCAVSSDVFAALLEGRAACAVLPIENTLHGAVTEHYDLLLANPVRIEAEGLLQIRHNLIAAPGVELSAIRTVLSHPVALNQCRHFLAEFTQARAVPFYDTAGSVKHIMAESLRDTAGLAPELAATEFGAHILLRGVEDHAQNYTRFHLIRRADDPAPAAPDPDKLSVAFALEHRPGTLVRALQALALAGVNLTRIESRPVPGRPWEYVFFAEFRFLRPAAAEAALDALRAEARMVRELGRYKAAPGLSPS
jgi:prephenate dehydratase